MKNVLIKDMHKFQNMQICFKTANTATKSRKAEKKKDYHLSLFFFFLPDILAVNWLHTVIVFVFHNCISNPMPWEYVDKFEVT